MNKREEGVVARATGHVWMTVLMDYEMVMIRLLDSGALGDPPIRLDMSVRKAEQD